MAPALMLAHEAHHSAESLRNRNLTDENSKEQKERDPNTGEKRVEESTTEHEGKVADEVNSSTGDDNAKRESYGDFSGPFTAESPTSNEEREKYSPEQRRRIAKEEKIKDKKANENQKTTGN